MNKIKVIDLLNMISKGEEVPKKFIVDGDTLYIGEDKFIEYANGKRIEWFIYPSWLNEEVEILEEEKKIPEKLIPTSLKGIDNLDEKIEIAHIDTISVIETLNQLIDYLKSKGDE